MGQTDQRVFGQIQPAKLTAHLALCFRNDPPSGYQRGKHRMSQLVERMLDCSPSRAQAMVDSMERHQLIRPQRSKPVSWRFSVGGHRRA